MVNIGRLAAIFLLECSKIGFKTLKIRAWLASTIKGLEFSDRLLDSNKPMK